MVIRHELRVDGPGEVLVAVVNGLGPAAGDAEVGVRHDERLRREGVRVLVAVGHHVVLQLLDIPPTVVALPGVCPLILLLEVVLPVLPARVLGVERVHSVPEQPAPEHEHALVPIDHLSERRPASLGLVAGPKHELAEVLLDYGQHRLEHGVLLLTRVVLRGRLVEANGYHLPPVAGQAQPRGRVPQDVGQRPADGRAVAVPDRLALAVAAVGVHHAGVHVEEAHAVRQGAGDVVFVVVRGARYVHALD
mmetsp:Transcript_17865/g.52130  ORF Transcript_17865/g.52130 Transcript_17865/m.52130 type:complete len:249 (+) Transcript_17865:352-1098(+)